MKGKAKCPRQPCTTRWAVHTTGAVVHEVIVDPFKVFYDSNLARHHHLHYEDTGELKDITDAYLDIAELPNNLRIEDVDIIIHAHHS